MHTQKNPQLTAEGFLSIYDLLQPPGLKGLRKILI